MQNPYLHMYIPNVRIEHGSGQTIAEFHVTYVCTYVASFYFPWLQTFCMQKTYLNYFI